MKQKTVKLININILLITILSFFTTLMLFRQPTEVQASSNWSEWKQIEGEWSSIVIGNTNILTSGCYILSEAIIARRSGIKTIKGKDFTSPKVFIDEAKANNIFDSSGAKSLNSMDILTSNEMIRISEESLSGKSNAEKITYMKGQQDKGYYMILSVSNKGHWMAVDTVSDKITLFDPASKATEFPVPKSSGGNHTVENIESVVMYENKKTPVQQSEKPSSGGEAPSDGEGTSDKKEDESSYVGDSGWKNKMINFQNTAYQATFRGLDTNNNKLISTSLAVGLNIFSNKAIKWAYIGMMFITTGIFFFMFASTIFYMVVLPNGMGGRKMTDIFEKVTRVDAHVSKQNTMKLIGRLGTVTVLIACLYANLLPLIISGILGLIQMFLSIF